MIEFVSATASGHNAELAIARKDKRPLPLPVSELCQSSAAQHPFRLRFSSVVGDIDLPRQAQIFFALYPVVLTYALTVLFYVHRQGEHPRLSLKTFQPIEFSGVFSNMLSSAHVSLCSVLESFTSTNHLVVSIIGIVCQKYNVLCETAGFNPHFASVYLQSVDFVSIRLVELVLQILFSLTIP